MNSILKLITGLLLSLLHVFVTYYLLWDLAATFDLEFIQRPSWRQFWGISLLFSLFVFPFTYKKIDRGNTSENGMGYIYNNLTLLGGLLFIYLFSLLLNWIL